MNIRLAEAGDQAAIVRMGMAFLGSTAYRSVFAANPEQLQVLVDFLLEKGAIFVADHSGGVPGLYGMCASHVYLHPLSGQLTGSEMAWWVDPGRRGGSAAIRLLSAAEQWAYESGAVAFQVVAPANAPPELEAFYLRRGYARIETLFQRPLDG